MVKSYSVKVREQLIHNGGACRLPITVGQSTSLVCRTHGANGANTILVCPSSAFCSVFVSVPPRLRLHACVYVVARVLGGRQVSDATSTHLVVGDDSGLLVLVVMVLLLLLLPLHVCCPVLLVLPLAPLSLLLVLLLVMMLTPRIRHNAVGLT